MRKGDYCVAHIPKLVEEECITSKRADELKNWVKFRNEHSEISDLSEGASTPLMREKDEDVETLAIQKAEKAIERGNIPTAKQVIQLIENARAELGKAKENEDHWREVEKKIREEEVVEERRHAEAEERRREEEVEEERRHEEVVERKRQEEAEAEAEERRREEEVADEDFGVPDGEPEVPDAGIDEEVVEKNREEAGVPEKNGDAEAEERRREEEVVEERRHAEAEERRGHEEVVVLRKKKKIIDTAEKSIVNAIKTALKKGVSRDDLKKMCDRVFFEATTLDGKCPMPESSATKGGAITTNLGGK